MDILERIDFGNEAADDIEPEELTSYFIEQKSFARFLDSKNKILIATAKKGVGKSALLQWTAYNASKNDEDALVIKARGADLVRSKFRLTHKLDTPNDYIRDWMVRICSLVNREIAERLNIALTDDQITMVECAELEGYRSRNLVGCLLDRFKKIFHDYNPEKQTIKDEFEILKRVKDRRLWILIDDLDATFQMTSSESLELSTFFSACRYLVQDLKDINFRVTMRTDVWSVIRRFDESLDKMEQYVNNILWYLSDFRSLLSKRIFSQLNLLNFHMPPDSRFINNEEKDEYIIKQVFVPKMDWADKEIHTYKVLYTLSYERPRWAIQLCKLAQERALRLNDSQISRLHINDIWGEYGKKRIADLVAEHKHQCNQIEELLNSFRGCNRLMTRDELFRWINNRVSNHIEAKIEGEATRSPREIARFLYRLGFILARSESEDGYQHYSFDQMPDFLSSRTDDDFGVKWEIHPCYREALDIKKLDKSHRARFERLRKEQSH